MTSFLFPPVSCWKKNNITIGMSGTMHSYFGSFAYLLFIPFKTFIIFKETEKHFKRLWMTVFLRAMFCSRTHINSEYKHAKIFAICLPLKGRTINGLHHRLCG